MVSPGRLGHLRCLSGRGCRAAPGVPAGTGAAVTAGTVYLLHFDQPYKHARHYVGNLREFAISEGGRAAL